MSLLPILEFPDSRLRTKAMPVETVTPELQAFIGDMLETMYAAPGIGLAATQVNYHRRLLVIDISETGDQPLVFINPELEILDPTPRGYEEGCLSVPGYFDEVKRPKRVKVTALDKQGESFTMEAEGLLAVCIQHEIDHLDGKLFVDYLSTLKRDRLKRKAMKDLRQTNQDSLTPK
jgi:peptide deformylase